MIIDVKQLTAIDADSIQWELLYQQKIHEMNCDILKAYAEGNDHFVTVIGPEFEEILRRYVFEQNTAQTRLEIKTLVDNFLNGVQSDGGIYAFKTVMDTSNNTPDVIDANMGVIDIFIEPVKGMEILVQKLTILRTGAIESGSFE